MAKNYYQILGVASNATQDQIRSAYRREATRLHPDHSGADCGPFLVLQEACEVLGDPARRRAYDDQLACESAPYRTRGGRAEPLRRRPCPVEPLVPMERSARRKDPFLDTPLQSLLEELLRAPWDDLRSATQPRADRTENIHLNVSLTRRQALSGGRIRAWIPVQVRCPTCDGQGDMVFFACPRCLGSGVLADEYPVEIAFPARVVDGSTGTVALRRPGMRTVHLTLHFRVGEW